MKRLFLIALACSVFACGSTVQNQDASDDTASLDVADTGSVNLGDASVSTTPDVYDRFNDPDARSPATPITAPNEQWTWVPFPDSVCANGSSTGIAVNLTNRSRKVLLFMMGGGACWDYLTCYAVPTASNITEGYNETSWNSEASQFARLPFFDRNNMNNPWRDANLVFIPYCTGDGHTGRNIRTYNVEGQPTPTFFMGHRNMEVFLRRLAPTFANATRVWLSGSSAGGFGAGFNWEQTQRAFGNTRVDVLDDSGPPLDSTARWGLWRSTWNMQLPSDCPECAMRASAMVDYYARRFGSSNNRFALLSYTRDQTISAFFAVQQSAFETQLMSFADRVNNIPPIRYFIVSGTSHTLFPTFDRLSSSDGTRLSTWLQQMVDDDPMWANKRP